MTKSPTRTRPLDRDGDGRDGGSLKGNQTAPMAPATDAWTRDDAAILADLLLIDDGFGLPANPVAVVAAWTDDQARAAQTWALSVHDAPASAPWPPAPDFLAPLITADETAPEADDEPDPVSEDAIAGRLRAPVEDHVHAEPAVADPAPSAAFTPEEIAAGQTSVVQEEGETAVAAGSDPVVMVPTGPGPGAAPAAVRLNSLRRLVDRRWFYKDEQGAYSPDYAPPVIDQAEADVWIAAGLAEWSPSAGRLGGLRVTAAARALLARERRAA